MTPVAVQGGQPAPETAVQKGAGLALLALAATALVVRERAHQAERANPPIGRFMTVDGVRLHYVEYGQGEPLMLLHGNGSLIQDFLASGLVAMAAERYRVIVFDRPGYGYSERPRTTIWSHAAQADLLAKAMRQLGSGPAIVLGHSWGASVALALGLSYPSLVKALVLASGYYYPTARKDVFFLSGPGIPVIGDVMRYTVSPVLGRLLWPRIMQKLFSPAPVSPSMQAFPRELALRPSQLRAGGAETGLLIPDAFALRPHYRELQRPAVIVAGAGDAVITTGRQSVPLHRELPGSRLHVLPGVGHMVHHTAPERVMAAIHEAAQMAREPETITSRAA